MPKKTLLLFAFVLLKFILQYYLVSPDYELHRDEYLHLDQGKHLAWGYLSVPPLTSWLSFVMLQLGNVEFWVRFFPALFGALTMVLVWKVVETLKGGTFALVLSAVAVLFSVLLRQNVLYQPNSLDTLCWVLLYFCVVKYIATRALSWIWVAAISFAVGFLNKYNIVFALIGLVPALLFTEHRVVFLKKQLYWAILLAVVLIAPNLFWQYRHDFPVFSHLKELTDTQLVNVSRASFLKDQLLYFIGSVFVIIAALVAFLVYAPFQRYRVIVYAALFTFVLFVLLRAKSYYAIGLYPILIAFGAVYLEVSLHTARKKWLRPIAVAIPVLLFIPLVRIAFPLQTPEQISANPAPYRKLGMLQWEDGKEHTLPQDFADMIGWKELARIVDSVYELIPDKANTLVRTDNYGQAGAINFYSRHQNINALSYNADYIYWFPQNKTYVNILMVKEVLDNDKQRKRERPLFDTVYLAGTVHNKFAREYGTAVYSLMGATAEVNAIIEADIKAVKDKQTLKR